MFAKKTIGKFLLAGALFTASFQTTDANCTQASGRENNGGCQTSRDEDGYSVYTCIQGNYWFWGNCNVAASKVITF
jgi:hypothetical protein